MATSTLSSSVSPPVSRRRAPRFTVEGRLRGHVAGYSQYVEIADIGFGGLSMVTSLPFVPGTRRQLRIVSSSGVVVRMPAVVVHCTRTAGRPPAQYVSGWKFLQTSTTEDDVQLLLDSVSGTLTFQ